MSSSSMVFDVCLIGHVTRDRIERAGAAPLHLPGGTAYYAGMAAQRLGLRTAVLTKLHPEDHALLADLEAAGVVVQALASPATTQFVNRYAGPGLDVRQQAVPALAAPFAPEDLGIEARAYLLGPLTLGDLPVACVAELARRPARLALDVQGLLRTVEDGRVEPAATDAARRCLPLVHLVKADRDEALRLTGAATIEEAARRLQAAGPAEVLITAGSQGAYLLAAQEAVHLPPIPPRRLVDTTGCGDTFLAAYLAGRLAGDAPAMAGRLATAAASAKIAYAGALRSAEGLPRHAPLTSADPA